jgi:hypothetical protein
VTTQPHDDDPRLTDDTVIDGEVIDGEIVEDELAGHHRAHADVVDADVTDDRFAGDPLDDRVTARLAALSAEIDGHPAVLGAPISAVLHSIADEAGSPPAEVLEAAVAEGGRLRRRRYAVTAVAALAVLGLSGTAVAATGWDDGGKTDRLVTAGPAASPAAQSPEPVPSILAETTTPARPAPSATVPGAPRGSAPAVVPARPAAPARPAGPAAPAPAAAALSVRYVGADDTSPKVGDTVTYTVSWADGDGRFYATEAVWGNDGSSASGGVMQRCSEVPSKRSGQKRLAHRWTKSGPQRVQLTVDTYDCTTYTLEKKSVWVTVNVAGAPKPPSPEPTPTDPSPSVSASTDPSA